MKLRIPAELLDYEPVTHTYYYNYFADSIRCSSCGANSQKQTCNYCGSDLLKTIFNKTD